MVQLWKKVLLQNNNTMNDEKILKIFVCDIVSVSDRKNREKYSKVVEIPSFFVFTDFVTKELFSSIKNFARPPTAQFNILTLTRNHLAI